MIEQKMQTQNRRHYWRSNQLIILLQNFFTSYDLFGGEDGEWASFAIIDTVAGLSLRNIATVIGLSSRDESSYIRLIGTNPILTSIGLIDFNRSNPYNLLPRYSRFIIVTLQKTSLEMSFIKYSGFQQLSSILTRFIYEKWERRIARRRISIHWNRTETLCMWTDKQTVYSEIEQHCADNAE
jgi:hypothetical protein